MDKIGIVIQGPTTYFAEILRNYVNYEYLVWSTWDDEPEQNIVQLEKSGINLVLNKKPVIAGYWNCNLQCISTLRGIEYLRNKFNVNKFIKVRSDFIVNPVQELITQIENSLNYNRICSIGYMIGYPFTFKSDFFMIDFILAGYYEDMVLLFSPKSELEIGLPFPEKWLEVNYFKEKRYIKKNINKLIKNYFFISSKKINYLNLKKNIDYKEYYDNNNILVLKPRIKERVLYFLWILPKYIVKKIIKYEK
ncbi:hypothetical protein [Haliscomenobacter sp.]|uniref:hypothetical protein n=1 Tax=Haliscomenobacter sp. TaxID=2717303 RepID=UPI003BA8F473